MNPGLAQPGKEKAPVRGKNTLQSLKGAYRKAGEGLFTRICSGRTRGNGFELRVCLCSIDGRNSLR